MEVDLAAIRANAAALAAAIAPASLCAVVKADGYGHGDVPSAEAALEAGASWLAVALVTEGARLREADVAAPILLLSEPDAADAAEVVRWRLTPTVYRHSFLDALERVAPAGFPVQVKVDTGMHRVGAPPVLAAELARRVAASPLRLQGIWTHFAVAEEDPAYTATQLRGLRMVVEALAAHGVRSDMVHAANTAGGLAYPDARLDLVRAGIGLFGLRPAPGLAPRVPLRPVPGRPTAVAAPFRPRPRWPPFPWATPTGCRGASPTAEGRSSSAASAILSPGRSLWTRSSSTSATTRWPWATRSCSSAARAPRRSPPRSGPSAWGSSSTRW
jgi:alanine racemase